LIRKDSSHSEKNIKETTVDILSQSTHKEAGSYKLSKGTDIKNINIRTYKTSLWYPFVDKCKVYVSIRIDP